MNLYEIYFSPTGGTKKVADIMIKAMKKDAQEIDMIKDPDKILQTEFIALEYSYTEKNIRGNEKRMKEVFDVLYQQAEKLLETIDFSKYENVLFISKSVGTVISSAYAQKHKIRCKQILYTPLEQTYKFEHPDAIAFLGTSDLWSNTANVKMLSNEQNVPIYMYKKADHSLETGDIIKDIEILEDVMKRTKKYL